MGLPTVQLKCSRKQDLYFHSRYSLFEILRIVASARPNNQGIAEARGAWIALLNNDAEARPEWLATMFRAIEQRSDYGMVACKILVYEDPHKIDKAGHLIYLDGQNRGRGSGQIDRGQFDRVEDVLWPDGCAAMYRAAMLKEIGAFDEDLFAYGDDAELGMRARIAGWKCVYVPDSVVLHRRGSTFGLLSNRRLELIERNRILLAVKHFPLSLLSFNGVYWLARLAAGAWAGLRGKGEAARFQRDRRKSQNHDGAPQGHSARIGDDSRNAAEAARHASNS